MRTDLVPHSHTTNTCLTPMSHGSASTSCGIFLLKKLALIKFVCRCTLLQHGYSVAISDLFLTMLLSRDVHDTGVLGSMIYAISLADLDRIARRRCFFVAVLFMSSIAVKWFKFAA